MRNPLRWGVVVFCLGLDPALATAQGDEEGASVSDEAESGDAEADRAEQAPAEEHAPGEVYSPPVTTVSLDNGLEVLLQPDDRAAQVAVCTAYGVGNRDDATGYSGIAHLMEHMAFRGSDHAPEGYLQILENAGVSAYNGVTSSDDTVYYSVVPPTRMATPLWVEADRMAYLLDGIDDEDVEAEQQIVRHEWEERGGGTFYEDMRRALVDELYPPGHPYRRMPDDPDDVEAVDLSDLQWFFQHWYQPHNARLAVVGRFDEAEARRLVNEWFGAIRPTGQRARRRSAEPVELTGQTTIHMRGAVSRSRVIVSWPTPASMTDDDASLAVLSWVLDGATDRRLEEALVSTRLARSVVSRQEGGELGSRFVIEATSAIDHSAEELLTAIDRVLDEMRGELVREGELSTAISALQRSLLGGEDAIGWRACNLARRRPADGGHYTIEYAHDRYGEVTQERVQDALQRLLPADRRVVVLLESDEDAGDVEIERIDRPGSAQ